MRQAVETSRPDPKQALVITATVLRRMRLSPSFARITLGGQGLKGFARRGFDQWFRMFMPRPGAEQLGLPLGDGEPGWYTRYLATPDGGRPFMRYVTVSEHRCGHPDDIAGPEIDVDVVLHGEPGAPGAGPLSTWAQTVEPGDAVAMLDQGLIYRPDHAADGVLLVGDETAVPAIAGILRSLPRGARGSAILEVPRRSDVQVMPGPEGVAVRWLPRSITRAQPGDLALQAAREVLGQVDQHPYVYAAGESRMTSALGMTLRDELAWPQHRFTTVGYWHHAAREQG